MESVFDFLPFEIIVHIFKQLSYQDKFKYQLVSKTWSDHLQYVIDNTPSKEISRELGLYYKIDETHRGLPDYGWYLTTPSTGYNICISVGWKALEYSCLMDDDCLMSEDENGSGNDKTEYPESNKSIYAITHGIACLKPRKLIQMLQTKFINERLTKFNQLYHKNFTPSDVGVTNESMPVLLAYENDFGELYVEFTLNDSEVYQPHDYKMKHILLPPLENVDGQNTSVAVEPKYMWIGLGDYWEEMEHVDILALFWNESESKYNITHNNETSGTLSHIFEYIVYATQEKND
jgi:hypothetical protein